MDNSVNQRINQAIKSCGFRSVNAFSKATGISQRTLSGCISGDREPRITLISEILKGLPTISVEWLVTGEGSMFKSSAKCGNVQIGTGNTMAGGDVSGGAGDGGEMERKVILLETEVRCLRGENERLRELLEKLIRK